jgi:hypothetical protein
LRRGKPYAWSAGPSRAEPRGVAAARQGRPWPPRPMVMRPGGPHHHVRTYEHPAVRSRRAALRRARAVARRAEPAEVGWGGKAPGSGLGEQPYVHRY